MEHCQITDGLIQARLSPHTEMANTLCGGDLEELANSVGVFFQSVSVHLPPLTSDSQFLNAGSNISKEYTITVDELERQLTNLKVNKATGPNGIPAWLCWDFAPLFGPPFVTGVCSEPLAHCGRGPPPQEISTR